MVANRRIEAAPYLDRREVGARLRTERERSDLTIEAAVTAFNRRSPTTRTRQWLNMIETGRRGVTVGELVDLCRVYGITTLDLLGE